MTETPPPEDTQNTPAETARKTRTRLQALAFFGGMAAAILAALLIVIGVGGHQARHASR